MGPDALVIDLRRSTLGAPDVPGNERVGDTGSLSSSPTASLHAGKEEVRQETSEQRILRLNEFARSRHPGLVGVHVTACDPDRVVGRLEVTAPLVAGTGYLWAPVIVTLADWLCACGMDPNLPPGASFTTIELKANFLGTVGEGGWIRGTAVPKHRGRTTHVWDVSVEDEASSKAIALFRCTQMILLPKA